MIFESFLEMQGLDMQIERDGEIIATVPGLPNRETATNRQYVGFRPKTDIKIDDVIITPANERLYVTETQASFFQKQQEEIKAFYMTEVEKKRKETEQHQSTIYNIGTAYGSVIGTANTATINYQTNFQELRERAEAENAPDKEQVQKLVDLVEMIVNEQIPPQKGLLSKFFGNDGTAFMGYKCDCLCACIVVDTTSALISMLKFSSAFPLLD